jgi:hypothetical protein
MKELSTEVQSAVSSASPAITAATANALKKVRLRTKLLGCLISTLFTLVIAEVVLHWLAPPLIRSMATMSAPKARLYGGAMPPNFRHRFVEPDSGRLLYAATNSQGWKDVEHAFDKRAGVYRILFLGDSFTWGFVPLEDLYTRHVEQLLKSRGYALVEVISIGLGGWGTEHCLEALINEGVLYSPDLVMYQFCSNDVLDNLRHTEAPFRYVLDDRDRLQRFENPITVAEPTRVDSLKAFLKSSALVTNLLSARVALNNYWNHDRGRPENRSRADFVENLMLDPTMVYYLYSAPAEHHSRELERAWRLLDALVGKIKEVANAHGADLAALAVSGGSAERDWHIRHGHFESDGTHDYVVRDGKRYSFDISRPLQDFEAICRARDISLVRRRREYKRFQSDCHLDKAGNQALAEDIVDFLDGWPRFRQRWGTTNH